MRDNEECTRARTGPSLARTPRTGKVGYTVRYTAVAGIRVSTSACATVWSSLTRREGNTARNGPFAHATQGQLPQPGTVPPVPGSTFRVAGDRERAGMPQKTSLTRRSSSNPTWLLRAWWHVQISPLARNNVRKSTPHPLPLRARVYSPTLSRTCAYALDPWSR